MRKKFAKELLKRKNKKEQNMKTIRVAVYGTLLKGECREGTLKSSELLGNFQTEPMYKMYSNGHYPCIVKGGTTSVHMEVYKLKNKDVLATLDNIEGVSSGLYTRETITTPYGKAFVYEQNENTDKNAVRILSGDWVEFNNKTI